jgi:hypothetical protein
MANEQRCRVCGCTWAEPCMVGCSWVERDLCSACEGTPGAAYKASIAGFKAAITRIRREKEELARTIVQLQTRILVDGDKKR